MLIEIYLALFGVASLFAVIASLQYTISSTRGKVKVNVFLSWFSAVMFLVLALSSGSIQYQHCATPVDMINGTIAEDKPNKTAAADDDYMYFSGQATGPERFDAPFQCTTFDVEQVGLIWLFGGIGLIMMLFAIINTIELIPGLLRV